MDKNSNSFLLVRIKALYFKAHKILPESNPNEKLPVVAKKIWWSSGNEKTIKLLKEIKNNPQSNGGWWSGIELFVSIEDHWSDSLDRMGSS